MIERVIIHEAYLTALQNAINHSLAQGYTLRGPMIQGSNGRLIQLMVKRVT